MFETIIEKYTTEPVKVQNIFIKQIKSAIVAIRKTGKRSDSKAIFNYITSKYASNTTKSTITDHITTLL